MPVLSLPLVFAALMLGKRSRSPGEDGEEQRAPAGPEPAGRCKDVYVRMRIKGGGEHTLLLSNQEFLGVSGEVRGELEREFEAKKVTIADLERKGTEPDRLRMLNLRYAQLESEIGRIETHERLCREFEEGPDPQSVTPTMERLGIPALRVASNTPATAHRVRAYVAYAERRMPGRVKPLTNVGLVLGLAGSQCTFGRTRVVDIPSIERKLGRRAVVIHYDREGAVEEDDYSSRVESEVVCRTHHGMPLDVEFFDRFRVSKEGRD